MTGLSDKLRDWVAAGLISDEQAKSITDFETEPQETTRVPMAAEAVGYVGGLLALAAILMLLGQTWNDLSTTAQLLLIGAPTLVVLAIGGFLRVAANRSVVRLASFLWALALVGAAFWVGLFSHSVLELSEMWGAMLAGATAVAVGTVLYGISRTAWQQLSLLVSILFFVASVMSYLKQDIGPTSLLVWSIGVVWLLLTWGGVLTPVTTGYVLGSVVAVLAPIGIEYGPIWTAFLGLLTAIGLVASGVVLRRVILLGIGGLGLFIQVPLAVFRFFGDELDPVLALLASGIILLVAALVLAQLGRKLMAKSATQAGRNSDGASTTHEPSSAGDSDRGPTAIERSVQDEQSHPDSNQPDTSGDSPSGLWGRS